jgi:hypothetical protein
MWMAEHTLANGDSVGALVHSPSFVSRYRRCENRDQKHTALDFRRKFRRSWLNQSRRLRPDFWLQVYLALATYSDNEESHIISLRLICGEGEDFAQNAVDDLSGSRVLADLQYLPEPFVSPLCPVTPILPERFEGT